MIIKLKMDIKDQFENLFVFYTGRLSEAGRPEKASQEIF